MSNVYLSVIIPAYNEKERIGKTLAQVVSFLEDQSYESEIIVVDDGSQDKTVVLAGEKLAQFPHQIIRNPVNQGKGMAVKQGILAGHGKFLLFTDADLSTPIEEVKRFLPFLEEGYDIVIGSRALPQSNVALPQHILRQTMGKVFNRLARLFTFDGIRDSQCGFKCFKREAAYDLFRRQRLAGFSFDAEILYLAQQRGLKILELPVTWRNSPQSRVHIIHDSFHMFVDLLKIRWLHRK